MTTDTVPDLSSLCSQSVINPLTPSLVEIYLSKAPFIPLPGSLNMRSITSPTLPPGRLYRSGNLALIPTPSLSQLRTTYNIRTIYDLRRFAEREKSPSPTVDGVETVWIRSTTDGMVTGRDENGVETMKEGPSEVPTSAFAEGDGIEAWKTSYRNILDTHGHIFKAILETIRDGGEGAVLIHCTAGRDRTGVFVALVLALCRTPRAIIAQDYLLTRIGVEPFRDYLFSQYFGMSIESAAGEAGVERKGLAREGVLEMCETRATSILGLLDWMDEKWGDAGRSSDTCPGVHGWFIKEMGFEEADRDKIEQRLGVMRA